VSNYEFCAEWAIDNIRDGNARVLDYGCGAGEIVIDLRKRGVKAFGCEVFYEGGDSSGFIDPSLFEDVIKRMNPGPRGYAIPFDDNSFDLVINNQVMEHVEDLDGTLAEIHRVMKPGGMVLSLFPIKSGWREGHCEIPFLHWFPKGSRPRVYYAAGWRLFGAGAHKGNKSIMRWSEDFCEWLDKWTYYRTEKEIYSSFSRYFSEFDFLEDRWLLGKLGKKRVLAAWMPASLQRIVARKLGGLAFTARYRPS
jgi:SAM-dependent methyltransferase